MKRSQVIDLFAHNFFPQLDAQTPAEFLEKRTAQIKSGVMFNDVSEDFVQLLVEVSSVCENVLHV